MRTLILFLILILSCNREVEVTDCYVFTNQTSRALKMETYRYYSSGAFLQEEYEIANSGVLIEKCVSSMARTFVTDAYRADSIIVKFDNSRRLVYLSSVASPTGNDSVFFADFWEQEPGTNNFFWRFTEEDYNNAIPY